VGEAQMADDWALALAHEFGHWLLYLFDTYTGVDGKSSLELTLLCTGTAMGDVYLPSNQNFIADPLFWQEKCGGTEAFARHNGRTEWATIRGWYPWVQLPAAPLAGPDAPPVPVTTVTFVPTAANAPAATTFDLLYRDGESSSGEARAFLLREGRVIEQGKPAKNSTQVNLTGPEVGDRLCVYDINDNAEPGEGPRHQFGCEFIAAGDAELVMTKNPAWKPLVAMEQTGPNRLAISVQQAALGNNVPLRGRLYPEHEGGLAEFELVRIGANYSATVTLTGTVPPVYLQLYAGEAPSQPATRRELIADRGTGGGGAHGPAKLYTGVLVVSSDGNATYEGDEPVELEAGESVGWQSMPGTPPLPIGRWIFGQSYRLDAFPDELVEGGTVQVVFDTGDLGPALGAASVDGGAAGPSIWFWDGAAWRELPTQVGVPAGEGDGVRLATALSAGEGVYAVLAPAPAGTISLLPIVRTP
jgi:hypothetical protein